MQYNIKTIDRNGNITSEEKGGGRKEKEDRPFKSRNERQQGHKQQGAGSQRKKDQQPRREQRGQQPRKEQQAARDQQPRKEQQGQQGSRDQQPRREQQSRKEQQGKNRDQQTRQAANADRQPNKGQGQQGQKDPQSHAEHQGQQNGKDKDRQPDRAASSKQRKNGGNRQKKSGSQKVKDIYDKDTRIWVQYQHYGTDDLSATVTFDKEQGEYRLTKVTITAVGGKLMDLWHVPTYTEGLEGLANPEEFSDLAMKLRIAKKLHREAAPSVDEAFVCVCDNETDYVMFPGGCPDNEELSGQAERFLNELGLKVARFCNPQEAMKNYGYI